MAEHLHIFAVGVAAKHHPLPEILVMNSLARYLVYNGFSGYIQKLTAGVTEVKIPLAIRPKHKGVHSVIVLLTANTLEQNLFPVGFVIAIVVGQHPHKWALRDNNFISLHPDTERGVE